MPITSKSFEALHLYYRENFLCVTYFSKKAKVLEKSASKEKLCRGRAYTER